MKVKKNIIFSGVVLVILCGCAIFCNTVKLSLSFTDNSKNDYSTDFQSSYYPTLSSGSNQDLLDSIFNSKVSEYNNHGYIPQVYEPSIQATYYALYVLNAIGKFNLVNQSKILNYLMSHYDPISFKFMDTLAYRYLDTDFSQTYFPLSTVLEVNCYAVLSIEILDSLDLINTQEMINFIWNCYHLGGFIGQQYELSLEPEFTVPTADNTFFAVMTLDLLMDDWEGYLTQKAAIIQFVNGLQISGVVGWMEGGFRNDADFLFDTLNPLLEPNLLSSYYCIRTLQIFGLEDIINLADFHQFLDYLYDPSSIFFRISVWDYGINCTNIPATALALELSDITNYENVDRDGVFTFIMKNRNSIGNWDQSTNFKFHELIDTFQIVRSLENNLSLFSLEDKNQLGNATLMYYSYGGFSLLFL